MTFKVTGRIEGLEQLTAELNKVDAKLRRSLLRKAVGAGNKILLKAAKANLRKNRTGQLRRAMGRKIKVYRKSGVAVGMVGPRKGFKIVDAWGRPVDPVLYAHLKEKGRKAVQAGTQSRTRTILGVLTVQGTKKTGKKALLIRTFKGRGGKRQGKLVFARSARAAPAEPFMQPALHSSRGAIRDAMAQVIRDGLASKASESGGEE